MTRVTRDLALSISLDSIRKMAKRFRQDIKAGDEHALARLRDVYGSARWARNAEIRKPGLTSGDGVVLGTWRTRSFGTMATSTCSSLPR